MSTIPNLNQAEGNFTSRKDCDGQEIDCWGCCLAPECAKSVGADFFHFWTSDILEPILNSLKFKKAAVVEWLKKLTMSELYQY